MYTIKEHRCYRAFKNETDIGYLGAGFISKSPCVDALDSFYHHYALVVVFEGHGHYIDENGTSYPLFPGSIFQRLPHKKHSLYIDEGPPWLEGFISLQHSPIFSPQIEEGLFSKKRDRTKYLEELTGIGCTTVDLLTRLNIINPELRVWQYDNYQELAPKIGALTASLDKAEDNEVATLQPDFIEFIGKTSRNINYQQKTMLPPWITAAIDRLKNDPTDRTPLPQVLVGLGKSYAHLRAEFKKYLGISPGNYRIKLRIEKACLLLTQNSYNVQEIADQLNYPDPFTFSAQFKQLMGVSPAKFR